MAGSTLCILGCGNLGIAILKALLNVSGDSQDAAAFKSFIPCVRSQNSEQRITGQFPKQVEDGIVKVSRGDNVAAVKEANVVILGVDPADVEETLKQDGLFDALKGKLLISIAAGWTREKIESTLASVGKTSNENERIWVIRTLPNIAAQVSQSLTAIEEPHKDTPKQHIEITEAIFNKIGQAVRLAPRLMNPATAVGGSTPAMWAVICDAFIDASVAVGVPRASAQAMIYQSMKGTAEMLQSGIHPGVLKDQGTSPEGCTIGGLMVLEEAGVRGSLGKALREAVTIARLMEKASDDFHVNDTRQRQ